MHLLGCSAVMKVQEGTAAFPSVLETTGSGLQYQPSFIPFAVFVCGITRFVPKSNRRGGRTRTARLLFSKVTEQQLAEALSGEIFPRAGAQAAGFIILSLARPPQCHRAAERDEGEYIRDEVQHAGV